MTRLAPHTGAARRMLVAVVAVVTLAACGGRSQSLGTTSSACFHALPTAATSIGHKGKLVGIRLVAPVGRLLLRVPQLRGIGPGKVCLVVFSGQFGPTNVAAPLDTRTGGYVIVVVPPDGSHVVTSIVVTKLPVAFNHPHSL